MKKLLALLMAFLLTFQLVTPVFAEEIEETQAATEAVEVETETSITEIPTTEPPVPETAAPEETSAPTEPQPTTEVTEVTETTASTEETTTEATEPTEPTLDLLSEDENVIASGECGADGDNLTWVLTEDGILTISGSGEMGNYSISYRDETYRTDAPWGRYWEQLTTAQIEMGATSVSGAAFYGCSKLTTVALPESVNSIGISAFCNCGSLTSITIPEGVTRIMASTFLGCDNLAKIEVPEGVTSIEDNAFTWCSNLTSVKIPKSVTSIGSCTFQGCEKLASVVLPDGISSIMASTFSGCSSLTKVEIPESVTSIGDEAFSGCSSLSSITIPEGVTSIGSGAFMWCKSLSSVTIPGCVTSIGNDTFYYCTGLVSIMLPESVTSIGARAFLHCSSLINVVIPDKVTAISSGTFSSCSSLTSVTIPEGMASIGDGAFSGCRELTSLAIPDSVISIGYGAFSWCQSLTSVTIPGSVADIHDQAFFECHNLTNVIILDGVTCINTGAFAGCGNLTSIIIPESVKRIGDEAFVRCGSLAYIKIPEGVTSIGKSAFGCEKLSRIWLPKSIKKISEYAFETSKNLKKVYFGGSKIDWDRIEIGECNSNLKKAKRYYNVTEPPKIEIYPGNIVTLVSESKVDLMVRALPEREKVNVQWSLASGDETYATISSSGVLTAKTVSEVQNITVIATPTDGSPEATKTIRILPQAKKIDLFVDGMSAPSTLNPDMYERTTLDFCAEVQPEGALTQVTWSSNNPKVAAVAADGTVTLLKPGTAVIKAMAADGSKVAAQVTLNVIYTDHSPELGVSALKLNTAYSLGTTVDFVERLGNRVETVSVSDDRFDISYEDNRLTLKAQEPGLKGTYKLTLEAVCADGRTYFYPLAVKAAPTLPRLTVKQTEKFNLFYRDSEVALTITGGEVEEAELISSDFVLDNKEGQWVIRYADPENAPAKPNTKAILSVTFAGYSMPVTKTLTISAVNTAPKLKLNPTASIVNTTLTNSLTVETAILGTEDTLTVRSATKGVTASVDNGILTLTLDTPKTTTATVYLKGSDWAKEIRLTHRITVTDKKPTVKLSAKGKLDVLNPVSEIVYTPKLTNATGTITDVRLEGQDANLFNAEVVDGLVHLKLAKSGENYATKKTYKVTPVVTLLGKDITAPTLSIKVTQSTLKLAKLPNRTVYQSQTAPLAVKLAVTSPANAKIGDVQLSAKTTAALRNALEAAGGIQADEAAVSFPAKAFAALKPGRYTVILDVFPSNAASDTKPTQVRFTLTVQK